MATCNQLVPKLEFPIYCNLHETKILNTYLIFTVWNREQREREREKELQERDRNERNERERSQMMEKERGDREMNNRQMPQQNGHRGLDAETVERIKQRKEEEEKRVLERKQAATKKLQELELKINNKKKLEMEENEAENGGGTTIVANNKPELSDFRAMTQISGSADRAQVQGHREQENRTKLERGNSGVENRDRDYGRYDKYDRDINSRERDGMYKDGYGNRGSSGGDRDAAGIPFSRQFQSNLPPRFQKQHQHERPSFSGSGSANLTVDRASDRDRSERSSYNTANRSGAANNSGYQNDQKPVPFAQQYDPRYISHSQNFNKQPVGQHAPLRRNPSDEMMSAKRNNNDLAGRKRIDSEEEDRFSSGRESLSRNSLSEKTPQLARSISDSSQRKTSVSSEDKPMEMFRSDRSESREFTGSWVDELEAAEMSGFSVKEDSPPPKVVEPVTVPSEPKHILQRQPKYSESSNTDKEKSEERDVASKLLQHHNEEKIQQLSPLPPVVMAVTELSKNWADCVNDTPDSSTKSDKSMDNLNKMDSSSVSMMDIAEEGKTVLEKSLDSNSSAPLQQQLQHQHLTAGSGGSKDDDKHSTRSYSSGGGQKDFNSGM